MKPCVTALLCMVLFFPCIAFRETVRVPAVPYGAACIVGVDVGGTNTRFGFFQVQNNKPVLLVSLHLKTKTIDSFTKSFSDLLVYAKKRYGITVCGACIGAPGPRSEARDFSAGGKTGLTIDAKEIRQKTGLQTVLVVNDFEIIGYGLEYVDPSCLVVLNEGNKRATTPRVIIGAGTGLGTAYMIWNNQLQRYETVSSHLACTPFCPKNNNELLFVRSYAPQDSDELFWTRMLGGQGVIAMRNFLAADKLCDDRTPSEVFAGYGSDQLCTDAVTLYLQLYARFAQIAALSVAPYGGMYLVGGVTTQNVQLLANGIFLKTFFCASRTSWLYNFFRDIPVYIVTDDKVNLYGAAQYLLCEIDSFPYFYRTIDPESLKTV